MSDTNLVPVRKVASGGAWGAAAYVLTLVLDAGVVAIPDGLTGIVPYLAAIVAAYVTKPHLPLEPAPPLDDDRRSQP